jgi:hypothetical protein
MEKDVAGAGGCVSGRPRAGGCVSGRPRALLTAIGTLIVIGAICHSVGHGQTADQDDWFLNDARVPGNLAPRAGQKPVVIAIVDDAFRLTHHDLAGFIWTNPKEIPGNRIDDDGNGYVDDVHGWDVADGDGDVSAPAGRTDLYHGTHLAGIVATIARAAYGDAAPRVVRILPVKSIADRSPTTYLEKGYDGVAYAIRAGADIVICSWGVGQISPRESAILQDAADRGILIVAAGGNLPEEREQFPAAHKTVLAVAATDRQGHKVVNSNFGQFIGITAPGVAIRGASHADDDGSAIRDGTSYSTAIVGAAAALVKLQHPSFSATELKACLLSGSTPVELPAREYSAKIGAGKLNVEAAVACHLLVDDTPAANHLTQTKGFLHAGRTKAASITWTIEPPGEFLGIRFTPAAGKSRGARGRLEFRADSSPGARVIASHSLDALPADIYVAGKTAHVTYVPERASASADWLLPYEAVSIDFSKQYCHGTEEIRVEGVLTDGSGPADYAARSDCKWHIVAPPGKRIRFQVDEFDTEAKVDLVEFFNGSRALQDQLMAVFSGPGTTPKEFTTWTNEVLVWFVTDGQNQGKGWQMRYRFVDQ